MQADKYLPPANEVCGGYVFTLVCLSTVGGWYPSMPNRWYALQVSGGGGAPGPQPGGKLRGLAKGGLQAHTQGGL